ncbi:MAG: nucleoside deaminase [Dissulfurimicrobium sp.]|uniref:nucleoside deaminase n=1 Tax=Dissulfurimicrobium TaxID=1769732 RepID=UPI003C78D7D7
MQGSCDFNDERWMGKALELASRALSNGEFPVGCVLVSGERVVGEGMRLNSKGGSANELDHAEIIALRDLVRREACITAAGCGDRHDLTAYSTLEPCLMCLGALVLNGVKRIVFAYEDVMGGACGLDLSTCNSVFLVSRAEDPVRFYTESLYNRMAHVKVIGGVRRDESLSLFRAFFSDPANSYWRGSLFAAYTELPNK